MPDKVEVFASGLVNSNDDLFIELLAKGYDLMHFLGFIEQNLCFIQEYCQYIAVGILDESCLVLSDFYDFITLYNLINR